MRSYKFCRFLYLRNELTCKFKYTTAAAGKYRDDQITYIKEVAQHNVTDWNKFKENVLLKQGNITEKSIDGVLLKYMVKYKYYNAVSSFVDHLKSSNDDLSLGSIKGILTFYCNIARDEELSADAKEFILKMHAKLYEKYKILDYITSEILLLALCHINEWEKALKVLEDIHYTSVPSHAAYSMIIATLFKLNKKKKAMEIVEKSMVAKRPLQHKAYEAWIDYILRKYKDKGVIAKYMGEICSHIMQHHETVSFKTAVKFMETYRSIGWNASFTKIQKEDGQCTTCMQRLECQKLSEEEFKVLESNIKDKLIVGSDLFLKTSPRELESFLNFVKKTAPYDIILDALNIAYAIGPVSNSEKMQFLNKVVDYFLQQNKKVLVLGRKHMLNWQRNIVNDILSKTCSFFTDNLSQDDPYFITAAILSGPHTDIVSKDLLRGHMFLLKNDQLRMLFKRWQWQHQWRTYVGRRQGLSVQPPLTFTPCPQKSENSWHLPYRQPKETLETSEVINDGLPDLDFWLCISNTKI